MMEIKLTQNKVAFIDDIDFDIVSKYKWYASRNYGTFYALHKTTRTPRKTIAMHRIIMNPPSDMQIDHINGNGLDNRRENLRVVTTKENQLNRRKQSSSKYPYISLRKNGKWSSSIPTKERLVHLGTFETEDMAYQRWLEESKKDIETLLKDHPLHKSIADVAKDILIKNNCKGIMWGDCWLLDEIANTCIHTSLMKQHPIVRHHRIFNALDDSEIFKKSFVSLPGMRGNNLVRYYEIVGFAA